MLKQVSITDLQQRTVEIINDLQYGPIVISLHGRPAAVIVTVEAYEHMERALAEVETRQARQIVEAGLSSYHAGRTSPQSAVADHIQASRRQK
jgi:prevent-host-death family protein